MNRLKHAASPYLLQHRDNPVDWWGMERGSLCRGEDEPASGPALDRLCRLSLVPRHGA
ncbi:DUF255 domain-containing protein [Bosea sp. (in: a-proteobacteria)]|uniref:DUF255 domain-containing protein n=1 Tax=Bosea sp. (in: a-proteobacteria) TaxID=1871050 RepID=UPI00345415BD